MYLLYSYEYNNGGLADMIKYFMVAIYIADKFNLDLYIKIQHPIARYLSINQKYICNFNYDDVEHLSTTKNLKYMIDNKHNFIYTTLSFFNGSIVQKEIPNSSGLFDKYNFFDYMDFSPEIYNLVNNIIDKKNYYVSIHLRCGDKYVSDSKDFFNDNRLNDLNYEQIIERIIKKNKNNQMYFFCDNNDIKKNIMQKCNKLKCIYNDTILNVSYDNSDKYSPDIINETFKQTLVEFLFIYLSDEIQSLTYSGFTLIPYLLRKKNNKFIKYYKLK